MQVMQILDCLLDCRQYYLLDSHAHRKRQLSSSDFDVFPAAGMWVWGTVPLALHVVWEYRKTTIPFNGVTCHRSF
jgi:hypothetical protein